MNTPNPKSPGALVQANDLAKTFDVSAPWLNRVIEGKPRQLLRAVDGVSFEIERGQTLALVGESGCGKSTVARLLVGLYEPTRGSLVFDGLDAHSVFKRGQEGRNLRRRIQMIFQDPYASLNPRWRVDNIIADPIRAFGLAKDNAEIEHRVPVEAWFTTNRFVTRVETGGKRVVKAVVDAGERLPDVDRGNNVWGK